MKNEPAVVVLAAGAGSRYRGTRHKLSEQLGGDSVLVRTLRNAIASEMSVVLVISEALIDEAQGLVAPEDMVVVDPRSQTGWGMGDSIAAGVSIHASATGWLVLPADMPLVKPSSLRAVADALDQQPIAFAQHRGRRGHPVGFGAELFSELVMLKGDEGARRLLARYPTAAVELDDPGVLFDIDTVDDLAVAQRRIDGLPTIAR
ncbi:nucleotidyltransferase family protein [Scleromatobacter humisilvae]|uniref:Nucleotidyltransferase family protein n=1 Tax=Scleromatobacter humisilvae TaxID=2897159 RepID=A0A9X1YJV9_9BURK|nr:nucleotidyltransferase family protein [Scleromatobacter humisilvae]MCK9687849.1 nucleotidyltransferase family protein [Scleromatobacter humisilvae]